MSFYILSQLPLHLQATDMEPRLPSTASMRKKNKTPGTCSLEFWVNPVPTLQHCVPASRLSLLVVQVYIELGTLCPKPKCLPCCIDDVHRPVRPTWSGPACGKPSLEVSSTVKKCRVGLGVPVFSDGLPDSTFWPAPFCQMPHQLAWTVLLLSQGRVFLATLGWHTEFQI